MPNEPIDKCMAEKKRTRHKRDIEMNKREARRRMGKGANQKTECPRISYDRRITTVEGKKRHNKKITSAEQKRQMN